MLSNSKVQSYLGFAIRSNNIILGIDDILKSKKVNLILIASGLAENSQKKLDNFAKQTGVLIETFEDEVFENLFKDKNVKVVAITDKSLANAIKENLSETKN